MSIKCRSVVACFLGYTAASASHGLSIQKHTPAAFQSPSPNTISSNVLNLTRSSGRGSQSGAMLQALRNGLPIPKYGAANLTSVQGFEFVATMKVGNQDLDFVVDTGSADTWVATQGFRCMDLYDYLEFPEDWCGFGDLYSSNSTTFSRIPNQNTWVHYGDGRWAVGSLGYEKLRIGGVTVKQEIGVMNLTGWTTDYPYSGLLGLAFPGLTNAFPGDTDANDSTSNVMHYDSIFTTMYKSKAVAPLFSIALNRGVGADGGYLAFGGLPPVKFLPEFASTPIQILDINYITGTPNNTERQFYLFDVQGLLYHNGSQNRFDSPWAKTQNNTGFQVIIDSGSSLNYFPSDLADSINNLFNPPPQYYSGVPFLDCNATSPTVGLKIGGQVFYINPEDMIYNPGDSNCQSAISGADGFYVLGDPFMRSVVSVFDIGASQMRFAAREYY